VRTTNRFGATTEDVAIGVAVIDGAARRRLRIHIHLFDHSPINRQDLGQILAFLDINSHVMKVQLARAEVFTIQPHSIKRFRRSFWLKEKQKALSPEHKKTTLDVMSVFDQLDKT
jgi:hypothetical protein